MIIRGGCIIGDDFRPKYADLRFDGEIITGVGNVAGDDVFDAKGMFVLPGFIDTHVHGAAGCEFSSADENFEKACIYEAQHGVTTLLPTVRCMPMQDMVAAQQNIIREMRAARRGATIAGINLEAPFVSEVRRGGLIAQYMLSPDVSAAETLCDAGEGYLKVITVAPELEGADELIKYLVSRGVRVSMGHSDATYAQASHGADMGASRITHTFNAMRGIHHREMGLAGFALTDKRVECEMICDLVHLTAECIRLIYSCRGASHISMISDSGVFAGMPDGEYIIMNVRRTVKDGRCLLADGTIAGSCETLYTGVKNLLEMGIPMGDVSRMASMTPAKAIGIDKRTGSLTPGKQADIVILDERYTIRAVFARGDRII